MKGLGASGKAGKKKKTVLEVRRWVSSPEQHNCRKATASVWVFTLNLKHEGFDQISEPS